MVRGPFSLSRLVKAEADTSDEPLAEETATSRSSQVWAMLIKRTLSTNNPAKSTRCVAPNVAAR